MMGIDQHSLYNSANQSRIGTKRIKTQIVPCIFFGSCDSKNGLLRRTDNLSDKFNSVNRSHFYTAAAGLYRELSRRRRRRSTCPARTNRYYLFEMTVFQTQSYMQLSCKWTPSVLKAIFHFFKQPFVGF